MAIVIGQVIHRHRYASTHSFVFSLVSELDVLPYNTRSRSRLDCVPGRSRIRFARTLILPLGNALPMYIHYTSDSLSVARLSLAYWQNMSGMCYQVESDIISSQNGQLSKHWTIAKH